MPSRKPKTHRNWHRLPKEQLLELRICDLGLKIKNSGIESRIKQLYRELERRELVFEPHFWLSDEWYCPDGIPGVAIPFFLAHPRLRKLEKEFMMEAEGADRNWCMKLLRHETGHAIYNAYKLGEIKGWREHFGKPGSAYPDIYLPKPYSRSFVLNLPNWYAQAHPLEDWAETFAVWLNPKSNWRRRYNGWKALKKLQYVDRLMQDIKHRRPRLSNKRTYYAVESMKLTLGEYYQDKITRYGMDSPEFFDFDLHKLFASKEDHPRAEKASRFIRTNKSYIIEIVRRWTGEYKYRINEVIKDMIVRCDELELRLPDDQENPLSEMSVCVAVSVMNKLHSEGFHISL